MAPCFGLVVFTYGSLCWSFSCLPALTNLTQAYTHTNTHTHGHEATKHEPHLSHKQTHTHGGHGVESHTIGSRSCRITSCERASSLISFDECCISPSASESCFASRLFILKGEKWHGSRNKTPLFVVGKLSTCHFTVQTANLELWEIKTELTSPPTHLLWQICSLSIIWVGGVTENARQQLLWLTHWRFNGKQAYRLHHHCTDYNICHLRQDNSD